MLKFHDFLFVVSRFIDCHDVFSSTTHGQRPQFPFPMQGVQSAFQPLQLANNPRAAAPLISHSSHQPLNRFRNQLVHTLSTTQALVFVMVAERPFGQQAAHIQVGGDPAIATGQKVVQPLSITVSQQFIPETMSANSRADRWDLRK